LSRGIAEAEIASIRGPGGTCNAETDHAGLGRSCDRKWDLRARAEAARADRRGRLKKSSAATDQARLARSCAVHQEDKALSRGRDEEASDDRSGKLKFSKTAIDQAGRAWSCEQNSLIVLIADAAIAGRRGGCHLCNPEKDHEVAARGRGMNCFRFLIEDEAIAGRRVGSATFRVANDDAMSAIS